MNRIVCGDNLPVLQAMEAGSVALIYVDPPFNTGRQHSAFNFGVSLLILYYVHLSAPAPPCCTR